MPSKIISKTVASCAIKEACLCVCLKSCKILKKSYPLSRVPSDSAEHFLSCQNNQNDSTVTVFTSDKVQNNVGYEIQTELESDTVVLQNSKPKVDFFSINRENAVQESNLMTDNHPATECDGVYGFEVTHSDAGDDSHLKVPQLGSCGDHIDGADGGDFCDLLSDDGQSRNNDRSDINIHSDNVVAQDDLLQMHEDALILPIHEEKRDIMSLSYTDLRNEILTNSDDPWLGLTLQFDVHRQEYDFELFFLDSECTDSLDSDFFNGLPSLLDSDYTSWLLSSPTDLDETLVHTSVTPCDGSDFSFQMDERFLYVQKRPYLHSFLERVSELFRIIIFTAGTRKYADQVLDVLDPERRLTSRLAYRDSCIFSNNGSYKKDLTVLGVDLAKLAMVDNTPAVFHELEVNNGIPIKSWVGDPADQELISLLPFLETLASSDDVRPFIAEKFK